MINNSACCVRSCNLWLPTAFWATAISATVWAATWTHQPRAARLGLTFRFHEMVRYSFQYIIQCGLAEAWTNISTVSTVMCALDTTIWVEGNWNFTPYSYTCFVLSLKNNLKTFLLDNAVASSLSNQWPWTVWIHFISVILYQVQTKKRSI